MTFPRPIHHIMSSNVFFLFIYVNLGQNYSKSRCKAIFHASINIIFTIIVIIIISCVKQSEITAVLGTPLLSMKNNYKTCEKRQ